MILYHGTNLYFAEKIVREGINVAINKGKELDLGAGFYLSDKNYATKIAFEKSKMPDDFDSDKVAIPALLKCDIDIESMLQKSVDDVLVFRRKNRVFLETVFQMRYNPDREIIDEGLVISPIADGNVNTAMRWYKKRETFLRREICLFRYWLPEPHTQYVFKSQDLCDRYVKIIDVYEL